MSAARTSPSWMASPHYQNYWGGSLLAHMALQMEVVVFGWLAFDLTGSATWVGIVAAVHGVPMLAFGPLAGTLSDTVKRKTMILASLLLSASVMAALAAILVWGTSVMWAIASASFLLGLGFAMYAPARQAMLPNLLPAGTLVRASTVEYSSTRITGFIGPILAGSLLATVGAVGTILVTALLLVLSAWRYNHTAEPVDEARLAASGSGSQGDGQRVAPSSVVAALRRNPPLLTLVLLSTTVVPVGLSFVKLLPVFTQNVAGAGPSALGVLMGTFSIGMAVSGFSVAAFERRIRHGPFILVTILAFAGGLAALSATTNIVAATTVIFLAGAAAGAFLSLINALLQANAENAVRGRIMALYGMIWGIVPIVTFVAGAAADYVGIGMVFVGLGGLCALGCSVVFATQKAAWRL